MKRKYLLISLISGIVAFTSCKEKATPTSSDHSATPTDQGAEAVSEPDTIQSTASAEERAAKLGFAKYMPKDLVSYEAFYNGRKALDQLIKTPIGEFILERMADEGVTLEDLMEDDQMASQLAMYGEEYFVGYGEGTLKATNLVMSLLERVCYYGARTGIFVADAQVRDGKFTPESPAVFLDGPLDGAIKDVLAMFAEAEMPAFYQGSKVSDEELREAVALQMEGAISTIEMFGGEMVEPITVKKGEGEFAGYKISGAKLAELIESLDMDTIKSFIDTDDINTFKASLAKKNLIILSGVMNEYVILFVGQSEEDFVLVEKVEESVCANEKMAYIDGYLDKNILYAGFYDEEMVTGLSSLGYRMISSAVNGANKGFNEAGALGDTRDVEALLEDFANQGLALAKLFTSTDAGYIVYLEDGIKAEAYGGANMPCLDSEKLHTFSPMDAGEGTMFFANWTSNEAYNQKLIKYIDTLGETAYLVSKRIAALDIDNTDFSKFKGGLDFFDTTFRTDALELWKALSMDLSAGLGAESALIVDVNGTFPKIPNFSKTLSKQGKVPRIAYVSQVSDRKKLQASWSRINTSIENILKTISEMRGSEIPMQVPMSSEKNDLKTWFVPIPFQNDDFVPSVSVSDELFFVSTSKTFSEGLAESAKQGGGASRNGAWLKVDFKILNAYAQQWFKLIEDNAEEVFTDENQRDNFIANKEKLRKALKALETLENMTLHTRSEGGRTRSSLHLKAN